jgi:hypothetical protein
MDAAQYPRRPARTRHCGLRRPLDYIKPLVLGQPVTDTLLGQ